MKFPSAFGRFFFGTLRRRLVTGVVLVHAVMMSLFIWDLTLRQQQMILDQQIAHTRSLARSLATSSANWLLAYDLAGLQEIVDAQMEYPDLEFALLTDNAGRVLAHSDRSKVGLVVLDMPEKTGLSIISRSKELVDVAVSAHISGRPTGWARVGIGQKTTRQSLSKVIRGGIIYTIAAIVAGSFLAWLMGRAFTRRLYIIQDAIDSIKSGDSQCRIRLDGTDEAAHLAGEFNAMLDTIAIREDELRKSETKLRQANADLENIVAARTRQVKESEERYRAIFVNSPDAYLMMELPDGKISDCNAAAEIMLKGERRAIIGKRPDEMSPRRQPDGTTSSEAVTRLITESLQNGKNSFEWVHRRFDGTDFWVHVKLSVFNLKGRKAMMVAWRDISENKRTEERLIQLADIVESSEDAIFSETLGGIITSWNHGAETLFGYAAQEMIGRSITRILPQENIREEEKILQIVSAGNTVSQLEGRRIRRDGSAIDVSVTASPIKKKQGQITGVSKIVRDITARKKAEAAQLEAKEAADRANRAKSEFVANMSHEIRTPLNGVIGLTHLMMQTRLDSKQAEYMQQISSSSKALLRVLNDILDYSKIEAGHLSLEISPFCMEDIFFNLANLFSAVAEEKHLEIFFEIAADFPHCYLGDVLRLNQVLNNLVGNAVKFTREGEIHIKIDIIEKSDRDALLSISVKDTGIGIPENLQGNLFKAFSQADSSTTRKFGGTGLGLVISKKIVDLMEGTISVCSRAGRGSTFSFTTRLKIDAEKPQSRNPEALKGMRVLVADDFGTSRRILKQTLESWSAQVVTAASGSEALERINTYSEKGNPFDIILLDWEMPGLKGLEVVRCMEMSAEKEHRGHSAVIIMVTASGREQLMAAADPPRIDGLLNKPVIPSTLFDLMIAIRNGKKVGKSPPFKGGQPLALEKFRRIQGAHVLLVEDNEINQVVARELLEAFGLDVTIAKNGRQAVMIHQTTRFDAVLMDLQMPEMDGFEAARIIRSTENGRQIPIIAMTAAAMVQDRQACLEAGMNDHIAKPIESATLLNTLLTWIDPKKQPSAMISAPVEKADTGSAFSLPGFDLDKAVERVAGNWNTIKRVLRIFAENHINAAAELEGLVRKGNRRDALRLLHNFKGITGNIGAEGLYENAVELEKQIAAGEKPDLARFGQLLSTALETIGNCPEMQASPAPLPAFDPAEAADTLARIHEIIMENRIVPEDLMSALSALFAGRPEAFRVSKLARQIEKFDYEESLETIKAIRNTMKKS